MNAQMRTGFGRGWFGAAVLLILLLALVASLQPAAPAAAAFPGANGKIVFDTERDGNSEIYTMDPSGKNQNRLTDNPAGDMHAAWSPNGQLIVFESLRDGNIEIYVMNADGSSQTRLTYHPASDMLPTWSPDGTKIAFTSQRDGNNEIYVMNADGSGRLRLTADPASDSSPSWSPDGMKIAFNSDRGVNMQDIYVMNADGSRVRQLTDNPGWDWDPAWSPDGNKIAFNRGHAFHDDINQDVWVMNANGSRQVNLSDNEAFDYGPSWSPDGNYIAFTRGLDLGYMEDIYVMRADGTDQVNLSNNGYANRSVDWQSLPMTLFVSFHGSGTQEGVAYTPADILAYDAAGGWPLYFDASDVGVDQNVTAFELLNDGSILLAFGRQQRISGAGTFTPQDIARFVPASLGDTTSGTFEWKLDGSAHGLNAPSEKIDAIGETSDGRIAISTSGLTSAPGIDGFSLKAQDEDVLAYDPTTERWATIFDGTAVGGLAIEDLTGFWIDSSTGELYISIPDAFNLAGIRGNGKDIIRLAPVGGEGYIPSIYWDGGNHLSSRIDAIELVTGSPAGLTWPIECIPGETCSGAIGYPDIDGDGLAFNCGAPGHRGKWTTAIDITWEQMDQGVPVYAAADGQVLWVFDDKYDRCPSNHPDCQGEGTVVCSEVGPYCNIDDCCCLWCFSDGNIIAIRHFGVDGVFATLYGHLKKDSALVVPGQYVEQGEKIAEVGSAGYTSGPRLNFWVWVGGYYKLADPWAGPCGPNVSNSLWAYNPPWASETDVIATDLLSAAVPIYEPDDLFGQFDLPMTDTLPTFCPSP